MTLIDNNSEIFYQGQHKPLRIGPFTLKMRTQPNIIVTGTPGVGKTTHCETLAQNTGLKHLSINDIVKERGCHDGFDEVFKSWIVDEDKVRQPYSLKEGGEV